MVNQIKGGVACIYKHAMWLFFGGEHNDKPDFLLGVMFDFDSITCVRIPGSVSGWRAGPKGLLSLQGVRAQPNPERKGRSKGLSRIRQTAEGQW